MIRKEELFEIGSFNKPHGISGEISVNLDEPDIDLGELKCIVTEIDGIFVPFFIDSVRRRGNNSVLIKIDGVADEKEANAFSRKTVYALRSDLDIPEPDFSDGLYAEDMVGFTLSDVEKGEIGLIVAINDTTDNVLFIVERTDGEEVFVPVAEELIAGIDVDRKTVVMNLPEGLLEL